MCEEMIIGILLGATGVLSIERLVDRFKTFLNGFSRKDEEEA